MSIAAESRPRHQAGWLLATGFLSSLLTALSLQLWRMDARVPLYPDGDTPYLLMLVHNIQRTGWFQSTPLLNAPFGQDLRGFPLSAADTLHLLVLKLLLVVTDPVGALNTYYLLGFPLVAVSCHLAVRRLQVTPATTTFVSVLFALAPYHFVRSEMHTFLSAYFMVPWACVLVLNALRGQLPVVTPGRWRSWLPGAALVLLIATTGIYYAAFTLMLLGAAVGLRLLDGGAKRELIAPAVFAVAVLGVVFFESLPNLLHPVIGAGADITGRVYGASEQYGLKIDHLLLPSPFHRVAALGAPARRTSEGPIVGEGGDTLGLLGAAGLMLAVLAVVSSGFGRERPLLRHCGQLILVAILIGAIAGLGGVLAASGVSYIRAWSRIAIFILFFALLATTVLWNGVRQRLDQLGSRGRLYRLILVPAIFALAVLDQTAPSYVPSYGANASSWRNDAAYFAAVEHATGRKASIFQLPFISFPEGLSPDPQVSPYDGLRGYLHGQSLRWSFGGIRGERTQWQPEVLRAGLAAALPRLRAVGFTAVQVDRLAYPDRGIAVERVLRAVSSRPPVEDGQSRWATYVIDRVRVDAALGVQTVLNPVQLVPGPDFESFDAADALLQTNASTPTLELLNVGVRPRSVHLRGTLQLDVPGKVTLRTSADSLATLRESPSRATIDAALTVPPGTTMVRLHVEPTERGRGPSPQVVLLTLQDLHVEDP